MRTILFLAALIGAAVSPVFARTEKGRWLVGGSGTGSFDTDDDGLKQTLVLLTPSAGYFRGPQRSPGRWPAAVSLPRKIYIQLSGGEPHHDRRPFTVCSNLLRPKPGETFPTKPGGLRADFVQTDVHQ